jgi:nucleotide-binding universal stress UspA family protein
LDEAFKMARRLGMKVTAVHVNDHPTKDALVRYAGEKGREVLREYVQADKKHLDKVLEPYRSSDVLEAVLFVEGRPVPEVLKMAENFDLVVLASESGTSWTKWFVGSVAEEITERCPVASLVVKGPVS